MRMHQLIQSATQLPGVGCCLFEPVQPLANERYRQLRYSELVRNDEPNRCNCLTVGRLSSPRCLRLGRSQLSPSPALDRFLWPATWKRAP